jgi:hypothetical protein
VSAFDGDVKAGESEVAADNVVRVNRRLFEALDEIVCVLNLSDRFFAPVLFLFSCHIISLL